MDVFPIKAFSDNYIWAIIDKAAGVFDCIDPGEALPVIEFAQSQQLELRTILLTHHHNDHIGGVAELLKRFPQALVYGPNDPRLPSRTQYVQEHQNLKVGSCTYQVLFNPGHTSSHISYYEPNHEWLFCGDTLFSAGCGRVFDGTIEQLHRSMQLFKSLPPSTQVFCAHEYTQNNLRFAETVEPNNAELKKYYQQLLEQKSGCSLPSTLAVEGKINPFLRTQVNEVIQYALKHGARSTDSLEVFKVLRNQKNLFV